MECILDQSTYLLMTTRLSTRLGAQWWSLLRRRFKRVYSSARADVDTAPSSPRLIAKWLSLI
ncbi:hypothetical protein [Pyrobaculum sp.]|uniref:hypothetical protein n=1 Tax=Pyrobaculum sp. TaxID=2004705 RepID=UPI003D124C0E